MERYEVLDLEVIKFNHCDIITDSYRDPDDVPGDVVND